MKYRIPQDQTGPSFIINTLFTFLIILHIGNVMLALLLTIVMLIHCMSIVLLFCLVCWIYRIYIRGAKSIPTRTVNSRTLSCDKSFTTVAILKPDCYPQHSVNSLFDFVEISFNLFYNHNDLERFIFIWALIQTNNDVLFQIHLLIVGIRTQSLSISKRAMLPCTVVVIFLVSTLPDLMDVNKTT